MTHILSNSILSQFKIELRDNKVEKVVKYLAESDNLDLFSIFKIHKLLLIPASRQELFNAYLSAAQRLINDPVQLQQEQNYITFLSYFVKSTLFERSILEDQVRPHLHKNIKDFLYLLIIPLTNYFEELASEFYKNLKKNTTANLTSENASELHEWAHNHLRGRTVDTFFALTNLLNFFSITKKSGVSCVITDASIEAVDIVDMIAISSHLNSYEFALDKVSFEEWLVTEVGVTNNKPVLTFTNSDFSLEKARDIGLRRILSSKILGRKRKRWLRLMLEEFAVNVLETAWDYYQNNTGIFLLGNEKLNVTKEKLFRLLDELDAEDELLVGTNFKENQVLSHYVSALTLCIFALAAENLKGKPSTLYNLTCPQIPEGMISELLSKTTIREIEIINYTRFYIIDIPAKHHIDIFKMPFIRDSEGIVYAIDFISSDNWPGRVRSALISGGDLSDRIGREWEEYVAKTMTDHDWDRVINGVKIKKNRQTITDIDLVAKRDDLILLIQMKVYYGTGVNNYEQWKFKNKLKNAVEQVKKAQEAIEEDKSILQRYFSDEQLTKITTIRSLVITNSHIFNGWSYRGIQIMSTGSLMQLINGATVSFKTQQGETIDKKRYTETDRLSTKDILDFLEKPLDWRIGQSNYVVKYHTEEFETCILRFPLVESQDIDLF